MSRPSLFEELPSYRDAMARGDWERAIAILEGRAGPAGSDTLPPREALTLAHLYGVRGRPGEAASILGRLASRAAPDVAAEALIMEADLQLAADPPPFRESEELLDRAARLAGRDARLLGLLAHVRGRLFWRRSAFERAAVCLEEARRHLEQAEDEEELARVLDALGSLHEHRGERRRALACYLLSLSKKALWRDLYGMGITLGNLGRLHLRMNEPEVALVCLRDDLRIAERIGDLHARVVVMINIGQALNELGRTDEAIEELQEALRLARARGWKEQQAYALKDLARTLASRGESDRAFALIRDALALLPESPPNYPRGQVLLTRGELFLMAEDLDGAAEAFASARRIFSALAARHEEALALARLAKIGERRGDWDSCSRFFALSTKCLDPYASTVLPELSELFEHLQGASTDRPLRRTVGPYRVLERIGAGAYAEVYRAYREGDPQAADVAVKCLRPLSLVGDAARRDRLARFHRECEVLERVRHPNVVRLIEWGDDRGPYIAMEFIAHGDLRSLVHPGAALPLGRAVSIVRDILSGLAVLHGHGIVHRDLKPANILLRGGREAVIADFGTARVLDLSAITVRGTVLGTLAYMAPEQRRGGRADVPSDIYALGVIFFQLLTGRLPFEGESAGAAHGIAPNPASLRPTLPPALIRCVLRCLEVNPERRYETARGVLESLEGLDFAADA